MTMWFWRGVSGANGSFGSGGAGGGTLTPAAVNFTLVTFSWTTRYCATALAQACASFYAAAGGVRSERHSIRTGLRVRS